MQEEDRFSFTSRAYFISIFMRRLICSCRTDPAGSRQLVDFFFFLFKYVLSKLTNCLPVFKILNNQACLFTISNNFFQIPYCIVCIIFPLWRTNEGKLLTG